MKQLNQETLLAEPQIVVLPTREGYDRWSEIYDAEDNPLIALETDQVADLLGNVSGLRILDVGCGTGRQTLKMAASGAEVTGMDFSEGMLAQALAKAHAKNVLFIRHDMTTRFPFEAAEFDVVTCCLVLDHIETPELLFREMRRVCREDGFILLSVMHPAMLLKGVEAQFPEPGTGRKIRPASASNQISDYVMAAMRAGLRFDRMSEHVVDEALAARSPRAQKYLGWPLLLLMRLRVAQ